MLECFQKSEVQKAQSIVPLVSGGIITVDEAREQLAYEPLPQEEPPEDGKPQQTSTFDQQVQAMYLRMKTRSHGRGRTDTDR
jgi:hypothetical protein